MEAIADALQGVTFLGVIISTLNVSTVWIGMCLAAENLRPIASHLRELREYLARFIAYLLVVVCSAIAAGVLPQRLGRRGSAPAARRRMAH